MSNHPFVIERLFDSPCLPFFIFVMTIFLIEE